MTAAEVVSKIICVLCAFCMWGAFGGFLYCTLYKRERKGFLWNFSVIIFVAFFVLLALWGALRNVDMSVGA